MRLITLLALLASSTALAADEDPDAFAVPEATPVESVPLEATTLAPEAEPEPADEVDSEGSPVSEPRGKFGRAPAPSPVPAPAPAAAPIAAPVPALAAGAAPASTPAPDVTPGDVEASAPQPLTPMTPPEPAPTMDPVPAPAPPVAPLREATASEAPLALPALPAPVPKPKFASENPPAPPAESPPVPPVEASAQPEEPDRWGQRARGRVRTGARSVQVWWDRTFHGLEPAEESAPPPPPPPETAPVRPFHAAATPPPAQAAPSDRPLAIPGPSSPVPETPAEPSSLAVAQPQPAPRPEPAPEPQPAPDEEPKPRSAGVWGGVHGATTSLYDGRARGQTFDIGFHLGRSFVLSGVTGRLDRRLGSLEVGYVGVRPGVVFMPDKRIHPRLDFLWGVAVDVDAPRQPFNVAEPRAALELSLNDWGRLEATLGYRAVPSSHPMASELSGVTAGLGIRLGWF